MAKRPSRYKKIPVEDQRLFLERKARDEKIAAAKSDRYVEMEFREIGRRAQTTSQTANNIYQSAISKLRRTFAGIDPADLVNDLADFSAALDAKPKILPPTLKHEPQLQYADRGPPMQMSEIYTDFDPETTTMVSGPLHTANFPGKRFTTLKQARTHWAARSRIYQDFSMPDAGRWIFRVDRKALKP